MTIDENTLYRIYKGKRDVSKRCKLENGRASLMWSQYDIVYYGLFRKILIGYLECGNIYITNNNYTYKEPR